MAKKRMRSECVTTLRRRGLRGGARSVVVSCRWGNNWLVLLCTLCKFGGKFKQEWRVAQYGHDFPVLGRLSTWIEHDPSESHHMQCTDGGSQSFASGD